MHHTHFASCTCPAIAILIFFFLVPACYPRTLELLAAGDVTLAARILEEPKPVQLFSDTARKRIASADVFLWNCETSGYSTASKANPYLFHTDGSLFSEFSFKNGVAITANNHVFDGYQEGAQNIISLLDSAQIRHHGLYDALTGYAPLLATQPPAPAVYILTGSPMSQIGSGPDTVTLNYPCLLEEIRQLRAAEPDSIIIVYAHDGLEYQAAPSARQRWWADQFARAGTDVILFSHNHQYCDAEILEKTPRKTLVAWSLGNFMFGGNLKWKNNADVRILSVQIDTESNKKTATWISGYTENWMFSLKE
ncbi:MAG: hypothetical protein EOM56_10395 [Deltaproteobacteria bacterium]|nr:hypothetical protein [Deltaproteobacteria bacterium]